MKRILAVLAFLFISLTLTTNSHALTYLNACGLIQNSDEYYILNVSVYYTPEESGNCFSFDDISNVIFDCQGKAIDLSSSTFDNKAAFYVQYPNNNITIKNCNITVGEIQPGSGGAFCLSISYLSFNYPNSFLFYDNNCSAAEDIENGVYPIEITDTYEIGAIYFNNYKTPENHGNMWLSPDGTGYSQICNNTNNDNFCDEPYGILDFNTYPPEEKWFDYAPLTIPNYCYPNWTVISNSTTCYNSTNLVNNVTWNDTSQCDSENLTFSEITYPTLQYLSSSYSQTCYNPVTVQNETIFYNDTFGCNYSVSSYSYIQCDEGYGCQEGQCALLSPLTIKLTGEFDYLEAEDVQIRIHAIVKNKLTDMSVSDANVTINIYKKGNFGNPLISTNMSESIPDTGIYSWSGGFIKNNTARWSKGIYLVYVKASYSDEAPATDILSFHIDPPADKIDSNFSILLILMIPLALFGCFAIIFFNKNIIKYYHKF